MKTNRKRINSKNRTLKIKLPKKTWNRVITFSFGISGIQSTLDALKADRCIKRARNSIKSMKSSIIWFQRVKNSKKTRKPTEVTIMVTNCKLYSTIRNLTPKQVLQRKEKSNRVHITKKYYKNMTKKSKNWTKSWKIKESRTTTFSNESTS